MVQGYSRGGQVTAKAQTLAVAAHARTSGSQRERETARAGKRDGDIERE